MPLNRYTLSGGLIAVLVLANIISYFCSGWGLITVKVKDVPLRQVIKNIEWQGWVTIYTNIDPNTKVTMWCDHVPLAEAMDTLSANIGGGPRGGEGSRADAPGGGTPSGNAGGSDNAQAPSGNQGALAGGTSPGAPGGNGPGDGRPRGRGGFGRGAQWGLAFFVAPTSGDAKTEIRSFQEGGTDDNAKIFHYPTPIQMLASDDDFPSADPRLQAWPGMKATPPAAPAPAPDPNAAPADNANVAAPEPASTAPAIDPNSLQAYLDALARGADIWIMAPAQWNPNVSNPPAANSTITGAVQNLVSNARGSVIPAIVLRSGRGGGGGGGGRRGFAGGDDTGWSAMEDRMRNAINGLPQDARDQALNQLNAESQFHQQLMTAPQDQRGQLMRQHMLEKMADGNMKHSTPEKRAQRYQRAVANRTAAKG